MTWDAVTGWIAMLLLRKRVPKDVFMAWLLLWFITIAVVILAVASALPKPGIAPSPLWPPQFTPAIATYSNPSTSSSSGSTTHRTRIPCAPSPAA